METRTAAVRNSGQQYYYIGYALEHIMCANDCVCKCLCVIIRTVCTGGCGNPRKDASDCYYIVIIFIKGNNIRDDKLRGGAYWHIYV